MNKIITLFIVALLANTLLMAQPKDNEKSEKIERLKVAMLSQRLNLDPKSAERFWPIYNQYTNERKVLLQQYKADRKADDMDAADKIEKEQRMLDLKKKYITEYSKVLNPTQINELYGAEKDFKEMIMRRMQQKEQRNDMREERMEGARGNRRNGEMREGNGRREMQQQAPRMERRMESQPREQAPPSLSR
jgi:hypothetical protein